MRASIKGWCGSLLFLLVAQMSLAQQAKQRWVDSVYNKLSLQEKIGQLFMVAAYSGGKNYNEDLITNLVNNGQVGGLIYMQGSAEAQATQTNKHQRNSKVPLLIAMDAEWGLGMRLTGITNMPRQMMYGAAADSALVYQMGMAIAYQCKRLGVHINFAPVVDVNNNPNNPVINFRSFGENKNEVARLGIAYMKGLQDHGIMACAKHFPGHGDTETDSHKDLPSITKSKAQLQEEEFYPFKKLIAAGIQSVMVAHMEVPALEKTSKLPTTLSYNTITNTLKKELGFKGLVFTDALNMQGVAKYYTPGDVDVRAFKAGNDVLLFSQDVPTAIDKIKTALNSGDIPMGQLETSVKKILAAKYDAGLTKLTAINPTSATEDINQYTLSLKRDAARAAVTLVKDENAALKQLKEPGTRVQYIGINENNSSATWERIKKQYSGARAAFLPKGSGAGLASTLLQSLSSYDVNLIVVHNMSFYPGVNYGLDVQQMNFLKQATQRGKTLLILNGNPYLLKNFCSAKSVVIAYEDDDITQNAMMDVLTGTYPFKGQLPVSPCASLKTALAPNEPSVPVVIPKVQEPTTEKKNLTCNEALSSVGYEEAGVSNPAALQKLDNFIGSCISKGAFPGCRILAAKDGKIFYDKAFGRLTYAAQSNMVNRQTLYDVASITKVLATTLAVMRLYEQGKINLNAPLNTYLKWTNGSDKANLKIKDLLLHQAGLKSWIPFYKKTLDSSGNLRADLYRNHSAKGYTYRVAQNLYIKDRYHDSVWDQILASPLENIGRYVYSDLDMYFLAAVVEQVSKKDIEQYVVDEFYHPLGLQSMMYNPLDKKIPPARIAPTENDKAFRQQQLQGFVHDPGAAMLGGIAGHAGLFATAHDVAVVFQMLLNGGIYQGKTFFKKSTVDLFTGYQSAKSRRGLGFDKTSPSNSDAGPVGDRASTQTFGHQGFTGTCAWADPETGIVFVFLSNRVHPDADNNAITRLGVRTAAQDYIYEAFGLPVNTNRKAGYPF